MVAVKNTFVVMVVLYFSLAISGCVVKSDQLKFIKSAAYVDTHSLERYAWTLEFGDYQTLLYASLVGHTTVFANQVGDAIVIENFALKEIHRLGLVRHFWQIIPDTQFDALYKQGQYVGSFYCDDWFESNTEGSESAQDVRQKTYKQTCQSENGSQIQNTVVIGRDGALRVMEFFLLGEKHSIKLRKST